VELLVVMVVLAIVAAMVVPMMANSAQSEVLAAARTVATDLQYAQNYAITCRDPVTVAFNRTNDSYDLRGNQSGLLSHPMTKSGYTVAFDARSGFDHADLVDARFGTSQSVTFDELGSPNESGYVIVGGGTQNWYVIVTAVTGSVRVSDTPPSP
jgi:Tfp pilus assembly protein FimT